MIWEHNSGATCSTIAMRKSRKVALS